MMFFKYAREGPFSKFQDYLEQKKFTYVQYGLRTRTYV